MRELLDTESEQQFEKPKDTQPQWKPGYILTIGAILLILGICLFTFTPTHNKKDLFNDTYYEQVSVVCMISGLLALLAGTLKLIFRKLR